MMPPILLLAAGASTRMGGTDKLMRAVDGEALLRSRARAALATGARVFAALPARKEWPARWEALDGLDLCRIEVMDAREGLSASLRAGIGALPEDAPGVLILLADMPEITAADLVAVASAFDGQRVVRGADAAGRPGHPIVLPAHLFGAAAQVTGDRGARALLPQDARLVPLPEGHAHTDLDSPADWAAWEALRSTRPPPRSTP